MPAVSKSVVIDTLFDALSQLPDFQYSKDELFDILKQTDIKFKSPTNNDHIKPTNPYLEFLRHNKPKSFGDNKDLSDLWTSIKADPSQLQFYNEQAKLINLQRGISLNDDGSPINSSLSSQQKIKQQILFYKNNCTTPSKPIFYGKKFTPLAQFKEFLKSHLNLPSNHSFSKADLALHKTSFHFDPNNYSDELPWFQFIQNNMTF